MLVGTEGSHTLIGQADAQIIISLRTNSLSRPSRSQILRSIYGNSVPHVVVACTSCPIPWISQATYSPRHRRFNSLFSPSTRSPYYSQLNSCDPSYLHHGRTPILGIRHRSPVFLIFRFLSSLSSVHCPVSYPPHPAVVVHNHPDTHRPFIISTIITIFVRRATLIYCHLVMQCSFNSGVPAFNINI